MLSASASESPVPANASGTTAGCGGMSGLRVGPEDDFASAGPMEDSQPGQKRL